MKPIPKWYRVYENKLLPTRDTLIAIDDGDVKNVQFCYKVIFASNKPSYTSTYHDNPRPNLEPRVWIQVYGVLKESKDHVGRVIITIIRAPEVGTPCLN